MRYVELAAFERLGRRARRATGGAGTFLSGASLAHAWRAGLLEDLLPVAAGLPGAAELTVSPGPAVEAALALLEPSAAEAAPVDGEPATGGGDAELVTALCEVLYPAMLAGYERRLALASPAADPPLARVLGRCRHDLAAVLEEGRRLPPAGGGGPPDGGADLAARLAARLPGEGPFGPIGQAG